MDRESCEYNVISSTTIAVACVRNAIIATMTLKCCYDVTVAAVAATASVAAAEYSAESVEGAIVAGGLAF